MQKNKISQQAFPFNAVQPEILSSLFHAFFFIVKTYITHSVTGFNWLNCIQVCYASKR